MAKQPKKDGVRAWFNFEIGPGFIIQVIALVFYFGVMYSDTTSTKEIAKKTADAFTVVLNDVTVLKTNYETIRVAVNRIEDKLERVK